MTKAERRAYNKAWRAAHPHYNRDWTRRWRAVPENKAKERQRPWYGWTGERQRGYAEILGVAVRIK